MKFEGAFGWIAATPQELSYAFKINVPGTDVFRKLSLKMAGNGEYAETQILDLVGISDVKVSSTEGVIKGAYAGILFSRFFNGRKVVVSFPLLQSEMERGQAFADALARMTTGQSTKPCPDCAEEVKFEARKCRFCNYEFA